MQTRTANYSVGQIVHHRMFGYRGVVIDVDDSFQGTPEWYEAVALSRPPKDRPWYHVLVHGSNMRTYVAERNLEAAGDTSPVENPLVGLYFGGWRGGRHVSRRKPN